MEEINKPGNEKATKEKKNNQKWFSGKINKSDNPINKLMQWG